MKAVTTGTVNDRIVQLDESVELPANCRVNVSIEPIQQDSRPSEDALQRIFDRADEIQFDSGGLRFTRDELHERD